MNELTISITIDTVEVGIQIPVREDGLMPYAVADMLKDVVDAALRAYKESGIALTEVIPDDDAAEG